MSRRRCRVRVCDGHLPRRVETRRIPRRWPPGCRLRGLSRGCAAAVPRSAVEQRATASPCSWTYQRRLCERRHPRLSGHEESDHGVGRAPLPVWGSRETRTRSAVRRVVSPLFLPVPPVPKLQSWCAEKSARQRNSCEPYSMLDNVRAPSVCQGLTVYLFELRFGLDEACTRDANTDSSSQQRNVGHCQSSLSASMW